MCALPKTKKRRNEYEYEHSPEPLETNRSSQIQESIMAFMQQAFFRPDRLTDSNSFDYLMPNFRVKKPQSASVNGLQTSKIWLINVDV